MKTATTTEETKLSSPSSVQMMKYTPTFVLQCYSLFQLEHSSTQSESFESIRLASVEHLTSLINAYKKLSAIIPPNNKVTQNSFFQPLKKLLNVLNRKEHNANQLRETQKIVTEGKDTSALIRKILKKIKRIFSKVKITLFDDFDNDQHGVMQFVKTIEEFSSQKDLSKPFETSHYIQTAIMFSTLAQNLPVILKSLGFTEITTLNFNQSELTIEQFQRVWMLPANPLDPNSFNPFEIRTNLTELLFNNKNVQTIDNLTLSCSNSFNNLIMGCVGKLLSNHLEEKAVNTVTHSSNEIISYFNITEELIQECSKVLDKPPVNSISPLAKQILAECLSLALGTVIVPILISIINQKEGKSNTVILTEVKRDLEKPETQPLFCKTLMKKIDSFLLSLKKATEPQIENLEKKSTSKTQPKSSLTSPGKANKVRSFFSSPKKMTTISKPPIDADKKINKQQQLLTDLTQWAELAKKSLPETLLPVSTVESAALAQPLEQKILENETNVKKQQPLSNPQYAISLDILERLKSSPNPNDQFNNSLSSLNEAPPPSSNFPKESKETLARKEATENETGKEQQNNNRAQIEKKDNTQKLLEEQKPVEGLQTPEISPPSNLPKENKKTLERKETRKNKPTEKQVKQSNHNNLTSPYSSLKPPLSSQDKFINPLQDKKCLPVVFLESPEIKNLSPESQEKIKNYAQKMIDCKNKLCPKNPIKHEDFIEFQKEIDLHMRAINSLIIFNDKAKLAFKCFVGALLGALFIGVLSTAIGLFLAGPGGTIGAGLLVIGVTKTAVMQAALLNAMLGACVTGLAAYQGYCFGLFKPVDPQLNFERAVVASAQGNKA